MSFILICGVLLFFFMAIDDVLKQKFGMDLVLMFVAIVWCSFFAWVFWPW